MGVGFQNDEALQTIVWVIFAGIPFSHLQPNPQWEVGNEKLLLKALLKIFKKK